MGKTLSNLDFAKALEVTPQRISVLRKEGMPMDSVEAALKWREERKAARSASAPKASLDGLDDGSLVDTIEEHRGLVGRARSVWQAAMEGGDPNQGKYQTAYNQSLKTLVDLEEELERRRILEGEFIRATDAKDAATTVIGQLLSLLDRMPAEIGEAANPANPPIAMEVMANHIRKIREEVSKSDAINPSLL